MKHTFPSSEQSRMRTMVVGALAGFALVTVGPAAAQTSVNRTVATPATGSVEISNVTGSVRVVGWDRAEVRVTGTLGRGTERLDVSSSGDGVRVEVVIPRGARDVEGSDLEVRIPIRKNVTAHGVSADVSVAGVNGSVRAQSTSGDVRVTGAPASVRAESTSGDVGVNVTTSRIDANSTSGDVRVAGTARESVVAEAVSGDVHVTASTPELIAKSVSGDVSSVAPARRVSASTVSGGINVGGGRVQYGSFETVSGEVRLSGTLETDAAINVQSHSGDVFLELPAGIDARFQIHTFSGSIRNAFGAAAQRAGRPGPGQELQFRNGNGSALVTVKTFSGSVQLRQRN